MILAAVVAVILVAAMVAIAFFNMKTAKLQTQAAMHLDVSAEQLIDAIVGLHGFSEALDEQAEQLLALRKQQKAILKEASQANATATRYLIKQRASLEQLDEMSVLIDRQRREGVDNG